MQIPTEWLTLQGYAALWHRDPQFRHFSNQLIGYLYRLRPHHSVTYRRYTGQKLEWCIRATAAFLLEGDNWQHYELSDDRLTITHRWCRPNPSKRRK